jgi:SAM-dependent methyltransferase
MSYYKPKKFSDHYWYAEFFNVRHDMFSGDDMMILEYKNAETQQAMFKHAADKFDLRGKRVLDVGCGLGYFKKYLDDSSAGCTSYQGIDLSEKMVAGARQRFGNFFERRDIFKQPFQENEFGVVFLISVLGYPVTDDPFAYMASLLRELYRVARVGLVFTHLAPGRRAEDSDFTVAPDVMREWCVKELSPNVVVDDTLGLVTYAVAVSKS